MTLAKDLGKSLEQVYELSTLELRLWVAYYRVEHKKQQAANRRKR